MPSMLQPQSEENETGNITEQGNETNVSSVTDYPDGGSLHVPVGVPSSPESPSSSPFEEAEDGGNQLSGATSPNQLVVYESKGNNGTEEGQPTQYPSFLIPRSFSPSKASPSIGAFTVQCASCFKWRLVPSKQKYEEMREHILEKPFFCETAREWRPDISCDVPTDISQDGTRLWAIDKPNIPQSPPGWQRLLHIRGEGSTKFADVYYVAPTGKKLRSMVEVQKYLAEHPEHVSEEATPSRFSFQIPRPLQENYVRKRPARVVAPGDNTKAPDATEAKPLTWIPPEDLTDLQLGLQTEPGLDPSRDMPSKKPRKSQPLTGGLNVENAEDQGNVDLDKTGHSSEGS
ncbi:PREDICTED: methyl-CpG-binding domain-containing protein 2 [Tarenaya hassleriana]|uniref:methyl-CpG-binding domain-containing protein 2 n=1 Tax=Tarenaya hassleriana TaxID=28532 RepID=UPI00053C954E|nr:PREDICTED: methyl-CpG-binding domain-containing protein 2 [Tarenaya hassleriana]XP_010541971.1 PREDICTED: methyl-CpG-binding domain-containing protein 2 [Tarenaya hassleriana]